MCRRWFDSCMYCCQDTGASSWSKLLLDIHSTNHALSVWGHSVVPETSVSFRLSMNQEATAVHAYKPKAPKDARLVQAWQWVHCQLVPWHLLHYLNVCQFANHSAVHCCHIDFACLLLPKSFSHQHHFYGRLWRSNIYSNRRVCCAACG